MLLGAEIDCRAEGDAQPPRYIELKTTKHFTEDNARAVSTWQRIKLLKFWIQSHLAGVPQIMCGLRDDQGLVQELRQLNTAEIPSLAAGQWVCMQQ